MPTRAASNLIVNGAESVYKSTSRVVMLLRCHVAPRVPDIFCAASTFCVSLYSIENNVHCECDTVLNTIAVFVARRVCWQKQLESSFEASPFLLRAIKNVIKILVSSIYLLEEASSRDTESYSKHLYIFVIIHYTIHII